MCITMCMPDCLVRRHGCCCCLDLRAGSAVAAVATLVSIMRTEAKVGGLSHTEMY